MPSECDFYDLLSSASFFPFICLTLYLSWHPLRFLSIEQKKMNILRARLDHFIPYGAVCRVVFFIHFLCRKSSKDLFSARCLDLTFTSTIIITPCHYENLNLISQREGQFFLPRIKMISYRDEREKAARSN